MPNGMSGCFRLSKRELREWLVSLGPSQGVGYTLSVQRPTEGERQVSARSPADATTVLEMLAEFKNDDVLVEEQDRSYYVIHLDADDNVDGTKWVMVWDTSLLFAFLRERHHTARRWG